MKFNSKKHNIYTVYKTVILDCKSEIDPLLDTELKVALEDFLNQILGICSYALHDRFIPSKAKKKSKTHKVSGVKSRDLALLLYGQTPKKVKKRELQILDMIAAFKLLENFMLKRKYKSSWEDLELGQFTLAFSMLFNNLPKLILDVDGIPNDEVKRKVLNLLFSSITIYRQFKVKTKPNVSTLKNPYTGTMSIKSILNEHWSHHQVSEWIQSLNLDIKSISDYNRLTIYSGNASSPNGGASGSNIIKDVAAVHKDAVLSMAARALASQFRGANEFLLLIDTLIANVAIDKDFAKDAIHSRLFHFTAPGGKSRIIANVDWISQTALSGIHFTLFKLLSTLPSDCTFNHPSGLELYDPASTDNYYSIDLSAATDRMPKELQARILSCLWTKFGKDGEFIASNWLKIVDREYSTVNSKINNGEPIRYNLGQGMGLFSSWTALAITHHYIANYLCGIPMSNYKIVGDDLLIKGTEEQFTKYLEIMKIIGMEVNLDKTIASYHGAPHNIEFARNYIISGLKMTPYPFGQLFAWTKEQCHFETAIISLLKVHNLSTVYKITREISTMTPIHMIELAFFLWCKLEYSFNEIFFINELHNLPINTGWVNEDNFIKIKDIMASNDVADSSSRYESLTSFLDTLKSQCTMRTVQDLIKSKEVSDAIILLSFADDRLTKASCMIHDRLVNANLISYDIELTGSPLLSKRERKLLKEALKFFNKKTKMPTSKGEKVDS